MLAHVQKHILDMQFSLFLRATEVYLLLMLVLLDNLFPRLLSMRRENSFRLLDKCDGQFDCYWKCSWFFFTCGWQKGKRWRELSVKLNVHNWRSPHFWLWLSSQVPLFGSHLLLLLYISITNPASFMQVGNYWGILMNGPETESNPVWNHPLSLRINKRVLRLTSYLQTSTSSYHYPLHKPLIATQSIMLIQKCFTRAIEVCIYFMVKLAIILRGY